MVWRSVWIWCDDQFEYVVTISLNMLWRSVWIWCDDQFARGLVIDIFHFFQLFSSSYCSKVLYVSCFTMLSMSLLVWLKSNTAHLCDSFWGSFIIQIILFTFATKKPLKFNVVSYPIIFITHFLPPFPFSFRNSTASFASLTSVKLNSEVTFSFRRL